MRIWRPSVSAQMVVPTSNKPRSARDAIGDQVLHALARHEHHLARPPAFLNVLQRAVRAERVDRLIDRFDQRVIPLPNRDRRRHRREGRAGERNPRDPALLDDVRGDPDVGGDRVERARGQPIEPVAQILDHDQLNARVRGQILARESPIR